MTLGEQILIGLGWIFVVYLFLGISATLWDNIASRRQERKEIEDGEAQS